MVQTSARYTQLSDKDDASRVSDSLHNETIPHTQRKDGVHRYRILISLAAIFLLILSIIQLAFTIKFTIKFRPYRPTESAAHQPEPEEPCGQVAAEAQARDCVFDYGLVSWIPKQCYNEDLDIAFRAREPFEFYYPNEDDTGPDYTNPITTMELLAGNPKRSWTTFRFHVAHCLHSWEYMHKALNDGKMLPIALGTYRHTSHCSGVAMNNTREWAGVDTKVTIDYPPCMKLGKVGL